MTPYIILLITTISFLLNMIASSTLKRLVERAREATVSGDEIARAILRMNKQQNVKIRRTDVIGENLYDPLIKVIVLDPEVYGRKTTYALAVGCHEACHALKFQFLRFVFTPISLIAKYIFIPLFLLAFFIDSSLLHHSVLLIYIFLFILRLIIEVFDEVKINTMSIRLLHKSKLVCFEEIKEAQKLFYFFNFTYLASLPLKIMIT